MNYTDPETRTALAAEYALGTLRGHARQRFERLMEADFKLRREVERWQNDLYPTLLEVLPDQPPPQRVWHAITHHTAPAPRLAEKRRNLSDRLAFWQVWSALATAATLALALYFLPAILLPTPTPEYLAVVYDSATQPAWLIQVNRKDQLLQVQVLRAQELAPGRDFELWLLPEGGKAPQSLGLVPAQGERRLALTSERLPQLTEAASLAVSLEPAGGSPTGSPTGPVLYQGPLLPTS